MPNSQMLTAEGLEVVGNDVAYGTSSQGFYAAPKDNGEYPAVVMVHEWWGLNQNIKDMALQLAKQGYQVLAVDLFDGKVASTAAEAQAQVGAFNQAKGLENLKAAVQYLKDKGATKIAALGWCFGGGQALQLSLSGEKLDATVLYYGTPLVTDETKLKAISWPVLGIFGDKDMAISTTSVTQFEDALARLNIEHQVTLYPGVGHAFANPSGMNYAPEETRDAWAKTLVFLQDSLK